MVQKSRGLLRTLLHGSRCAVGSDAEDRGGPGLQSKHVSVI